MKLIYTPIYLSLFSIVLVSCSEEKKEKPVEKNTALIIGDPLDCGLDSLTLFPVGASYNPVVVEPEERADEGVVEDQMAFEEAQYSLRSSDVSFTTNQAAGNCNYAVVKDYLSRLGPLLHFVECTLSFQTKSNEQVT